MTTWQRPCRKAKKWNAVSPWDLYLFLRKNILLFLLFNMAAVTWSCRTSIYRWRLSPSISPQGRQDNDPRTRSFVPGLTVPGGRKLDPLEHHAPACQSAGKGQKKERLLYMYGKKSYDARNVTHRPICKGVALQLSCHSHLLSCI